MLKALKYLFLSFLPAVVLSQNHNHQIDQPSINSSLSQSSVRSMVQDRNGFIWIATQEGLHRFDGYEVVVYKNIPGDSNSISDNLINCIIEDKEGFLWIGTLNGLNKYDPAKNKFIIYYPDRKNKNSIAGKCILSLYEDKQGFIWAGTYLDGLSKYDKKNNIFINYSHNPGNPNSLSDNSVLAIKEDKSDNTWFATFSGGLNRYDRQKDEFINYTHNRSNKNSISSNVISSLEVDDNDNLWIGTPNGLNIFNKETNIFKKYYFDHRDVNSISSNVIQTVYKDPSGHMWVGTRDGGLNFFDSKNNKFLRYQNNSYDPLSLNENNILSLLMDQSNILWVGTNTKGLNKLYPFPSKFQIIKNEFNHPEVLTNNSIRAICEDDSGNIWIGTDDGLNILDSKKNIIRKLKKDPLNNNSICDNRIKALLKDYNGNIWIGTDVALDKYDYKKKKFFHFSFSEKNKKGFPFYAVRNIFQDIDGTLWLATFGFGAIKFDQNKKEFKSYVYSGTDISSINNNVVLQIYGDQNNRLWFCTPAGLNLLNTSTGTFKRFSNDPNSLMKLGNNAIYSVYEYDREIFFLGTHSGGMIKFNPENYSIKRFTEKDGLPSNVIYGILKDGKNNLWLSTNKGISKFNPATEKFINYDINDDLPANEFNSGAFYKSSKGKLYFGSVNGLVVFSPDSIWENKNHSKIVITKFRIFEKPVPGIEFITDKKNIELSYRDNYFSFEFAALEYTAPNKIQYAYCLEGYDNGWINSGSRRYVSYTNLDPGQYTFRIKASNSDGLWKEAGISVIISINPPYWQKWWFRIITIGFILILVFYIYERRISRLKKDRQLQQRFSEQLIDSQENERKRIAAELHDSIGQNLIIIKNRAAFGIESGKLENKDEQLREIIDISSQTISDTREISYNLRPYQLGKLGLTRAVESVIKKAASATKIDIHSAIEAIDNVFSEDNEIHFYRIVQELLNNTIKHSNATNSLINIVKNENKLTLTYSDNGIGFSKDNLALKNDSTGFGLMDITERVKILGGTLDIETSPKHGVNILIHIILRNQ